MTEYLLLTPGPHSTTETVKQAMLKDWCDIDSDFYSDIEQDVRQRLIRLATAQATDDALNQDYDAVLLTGNEINAIEAVITSVASPDKKLLIINNGVNGQHLVNIAKLFKLNYQEYHLQHDMPADAAHLDRLLAGDKRIGWVVMTHIESSSGLINPLKAITRITKQHNRQVIIDSTYGFGGVNLDISALDIDFLVTTPSHSLQGIAGISFVLAKKQCLQAMEHQAKSYSLDLYQHWQRQQQNQWRFTCPIHVIAALQQALIELEEEGGISARALRYGVNQKLLYQGMIEMDFQPILAKQNQSTIVTSFYAPSHKSYAFTHFYQLLKHQGYIIYSGAIDGINSFRIANIGNVYPADIKSLLVTIEKCRYWLRE